MAKSHKDKSRVETLETESPSRKAHHGTTLLLRLVRFTSYSNPGIFLCEQEGSKEGDIGVDGEDEETREKKGDQGRSAINFLDYNGAL